MESYEFYKMHRNGTTYLYYRCYRGGCKGREVMVADRNTHNNYHNHVDNGLPNPYDYGDNEWRF